MMFMIGKVYVSNRVRIQAKNSKNKPPPFLILIIASKIKKNEGSRGHKVKYGKSWFIIWFI